MVPLPPYVGPSLHLMHDNARSYIDNIVQNYLNEIDIRFLELPAQSPHMNPIQHAWDHIEFTEEWKWVGSDYIILLRLCPGEE